MIGFEGPWEVRHRDWLGIDSDVDGPERLFPLLREMRRAEEPNSDSGGRNMVIAETFSELDLGVGGTLVGRALSLTGGALLNLIFGIDAASELQFQPAAFQEPRRSGVVVTLSRVEVRNAPKLYLQV